MRLLLLCSINSDGIPCGVSGTLSLSLRTAFGMKSALTRTKSKCLLHRTRKSIAHRYLFRKHYRSRSGTRSYCRWFSIAIELSQLFFKDMNPVRLQFIINASFNWTSVSTINHMLTKQRSMHGKSFSVFHLSIFQFLRFFGGETFLSKTYCDEKISLLKIEFEVIPGRKLSHEIERISEAKHRKCGMR